MQCKSGFIQSARKITQSISNEGLNLSAQFTLWKKKELLQQRKISMLRNSASYIFKKNSANKQQNKPESLNVFLLVFSQFSSDDFPIVLFLSFMSGVSFKALFKDAAQKSLPYCPHKSKTFLVVYRACGASKWFGTSSWTSKECERDRRRRNTSGLWWSPLF